MSFLLGVLEASIVGGIGILAVYIFSKKSGNSYRKKYRMLLWFLIAVRLLTPVHFGVGEPAAIIEVPTYALEEQEVLQNENAAGVHDEIVTEDVGSGIAHSTSNMAKEEAKQESLAIWKVVSLIWLLGAVLCLGYFLISYVTTSQKLKRCSTLCEEDNINQMVDRIAAEFKMRKVPEIRVMQAECVSPFVLGFFKNIVYLPNINFEEKNWEYVLRHELFHCKNKDIIKKWFFILVNAFQWFNPMVWLMRKMINQDMELICDEEILRDATKEERREYCELIMSYINSDTAGKYSVSTGYMQGANFIKQRFENIFDMKKKRSGMLAAGGIICVLLFASSCIHIKLPVAVTELEYQAFSGRINEEPAVMVAYWDGDLLTLYYTNTDRTEEGKLSGAYDMDRNAFRLMAEESGSVLEGEYYVNNNGMVCLKGDLIAEDGSKAELAAEYVRSYENHEDDTKAVFTQEGAWEYDAFEVLAFIEVFAEAVQKDDEETLAGMMSYPMTVSEDKGYRQIENTQEFLNSYDTIVTEEMKKNVEEGLQSNLFINYMGVHFGNVLFYSTDEGIFHINNISEADVYPDAEDGGIPGGNVEKG